MHSQNMPTGFQIGLSLRLVQVIQYGIILYVKGIRQTIGELSWLFQLPNRTPKMTMTKLNDARQSLTVKIQGQMKGIDHTVVMHKTEKTRCGIETTIMTSLSCPQQPQILMPCG